MSLIHCSEEINKFLLGKCHNQYFFKILFNKTVWTYFRILSTLGFSAAMTHPFHYLLACAGWRAASHEQEDHLQSWQATVAPSPGRRKGVLLHTETKGQEKNNVNRPRWKLLHCVYSVHNSPSHSTLWESCDRGISWWHTKKLFYSGDISDSTH